MTPFSMLKLAAVAATALIATTMFTPVTRADDAPAAPVPPRLPHLFLIGDSTVKNGTKDLQGWGTSLPAFFDPTKITIENRARGGRSSRTYLIEGLWDATLADLQPGDYLLMQFGHNDGGPVFTATARASLHGTGEEIEEGENPNTKQHEVVHTYGWYLRKFIADAKAKGAIPIVLSPVPRNRWDDKGKVLRSANDYGKWAQESATSGGVAFVDLNAIIADRYDVMGTDKVKALFPGDWTHTNPAGADLNAECVVSGLKGIQSQLAADLSDKGAQVTAYAAKAVNEVKPAVIKPAAEVK